MRMRVVLVAVAALVAAACGSNTSSTAGAGDPAAADPAAADPATTVSPSGSSAPGTVAIMALPITDARTGETFTLADYAGMPLYVENFATWCTNCKKQLQNVQAATAGSDADVAYVSLSVETDLSAEDIATYADDEGFDGIRFAVMSPEMLAAMNDQFGNSSLNPPSTPHFVVAADGQIGELATGFKEPDQVLASLGVSGG